MKNLIKTISVASVSAYALTMSTIASADWGDSSNPGGMSSDLEGTVMSLIEWILAFVALIATLMLIWGGVQYLIAGGNDDQVGNAKKTLSYGVIGLVIVGLSYAIVKVILEIIT